MEILSAQYAARRILLQAVGFELAVIEDSDDVQLVLPQNTPLMQVNAAAALLSNTETSDGQHSACGKVITTGHL